ncbi:MAG: recombinase family protein [Chloroflexi bacterium]|nr:recombinase family protein [Chloroflexota bacterium]
MVQRLAAVNPSVPSEKVAIVYDRASTERQRDNYSRADAARLIELAQPHGFEHCEIRQEIKSGESLTNRPVMKRILEEVEAGVIGAIICQDFTRLSRDQDGIDGRIIRQVCRDNDCLIITPDKSYDFSLDVDDDLADIGFFIGKIQKRQNLRAMARGMMEKARQGKMLPQVPLMGYRWTATDPTTGRKAPGAELQIRPDDIPILHAIYDRYERMSARKTAHSLNADGYSFPGRQGQGHPFRAADILRIVANPIYTGMVAWGRRVRSPHLKGFQAVERHVPELQIISFEQFNRVQEIARQRYWMPPKSVGSPFLLSGVLKCARCGSAMVGQRQYKKRAGDTIEWHFYQCRAYHQYGKTACVGVCVSEFVARPTVEGFLARVLGEQLDLRAYLRDAAEEMVTDDERVAALKAEVQEAEAGLRRLVDAMAAGALDVDAAREKTLELRERKERDAALLPLRRPDG